MNIKFKIKSVSKGFASFKVKNKDGSVVKEFSNSNLILDSYYKDSNFHKGDRINIGTGTTEPVASDTGLEAEIAVSPVKTWVNSSRASTPSNSQTTKRSRYIAHEFRGSSVEGLPISEVGVRTASTQYTRLLIKDDFGELAPITLMEGQSLAVTYFIEVEFDRMLTDIVSVPTPESWPPALSGTLDFCIGQIRPFNGPENLGSFFSFKNINTRLGNRSGVTTTEDTTLKKIKVSYNSNGALSSSNSDLIPDNTSNSTTFPNGEKFYGSDSVFEFSVMVRLRDSNNVIKTVTVPANFNFSFEFEFTYGRA